MTYSIYVIPLIILLANACSSSFYEKVQDGQVDLTDEGNFAQFAAETCTKYPEARSTYFGSMEKPLLDKFINATIFISAAGPTEDMHVEMINIARYGYFKAVPADFKPETFKNVWDREFDPQWLAVARDIFRNIGVSYDSDPIFSQIYEKTKHKSFLDERMDFVENINAHVHLTSSSSEGIEKLLSPGVLAIHLGDGTITDEIDLEGESIEGSHHIVTTSSFEFFLDKFKESPEYLKLLDEESIQRLQKKFSLLRKHFLVYVKVIKKFGSLGFEYWEDMILEFFKLMPEGEELLLTSGYPKHAMLLSIEKRAGLYEIKVFNSGGGIQYHQYTLKGKFKKYFPARRFSGLSLAKLKRSALFRRLAEIKSNIPVEGMARSYDEKDYYLHILAALHPFERSFTSEDSRIFGLIADQRSGTCAVRSLMAYLSFNLKERFRPVKLALNKLLIQYAARDKVWKKDDLAVVQRVLKFAFENHARSILKFKTHDQRLFSKLENIDIKIFGDEAFFSLYNRFRVSPGFDTSDKFNVPLENVSANVKFHSDTLSKAQKLESLFAPFNDLNRSNVKPEMTEECLNYIKVLAAPPTPETFGDRLDALTSMVDGTCSLLERDAQYSLLVGDVVYHWPIPKLTENGDFWYTFLGDSKTEEGGLKLKAIFNIAADILDRTVSVGVYNPSTMVAINLITTVLFHDFRRECPRIAEVAPIASKGYNPYLIIDPKLRRRDEAIRAYYPAEAESRLDIMKEAAVEEYFKKYDLAEFWKSSNLSLTDRNREARRNRVHESLPVSYYLLSSLVQISEMMDSDSFSKENLFYFEEDRKFIGERVLSFETVQASEKVPPLIRYNYNSFKEQPYRLQRCSIESRAVLEIQQKGLDEQLKALGFSDDEASLSYNLFCGEELSINHFYHLLRESHEMFDWGSMLYLGMYSIDRSNLNSSDKFKFSEMLSGSLSKLIGEDLAFIIENKAELQKAIKIANQTQVNESKDSESEASPSGKAKRAELLFLRRVRRCSAALIILSHVDFTPDSSQLLNDRQRQFLAILQSPSIKPDHLAYLAYGYLGSFSAQHVTLDQASSILKINQRLLGVEDSVQGVYEHSTFRSQLKTTITQAALKIAADGGTQVLNSCLDSSDPSISALPKKFPFIETNDGYVHDLVQGMSFSRNGECVSSIPFSYARKYIVSANINISSADVARVTKSSTKTSTGQQLSLTRIILKNSPGSVDFSELDVLLDEKGKDSIVKDLGRGNQQVLVSDRALVDAAPLPETLPSEQDFLCWVSIEVNKIEYTNGREKIISHGGVLDYGYRDLKNLELLDTADPVDNPLDSKTFVFRESKTSSKFVMFPKQAGTSLRSLWLVMENGSTNWKLFEDSKLSVSPLQHFHQKTYFQHLLRLQSAEDELKILLPIEHYSVTPNESSNSFELDRIGQLSSPFRMVFSQVHSRKRKKTELVSMNKEGIIKASSRYQLLLLCYRYIISRKYGEAFQMLRNVHQMEKFNNSEHQMLIWIVSSSQANLDGSPEAAAIISFAAFKVHANRRLFSSNVLNTAADAQNESIDPYQVDQPWESFWNNSKIAKSIELALERYTRNYEKVPSDLRFDHSTGRGLVTEEELRDWLQSYTMPRAFFFETGNNQDHSSSQPHINFEFTAEEGHTCYNALRSSHSKILPFNFSDLSSVNPLKMKDRVLDFVCRRFAESYELDTLQRHKDYFKTFAHTASAPWSNFVIAAIELSENELHAVRMKLMNDCKSLPDLVTNAICQSSFQKILNEINEKYLDKDDLKQTDKFVPVTWKSLEAETESERSKEAVDPSFSIMYQSISTTKDLVSDSKAVQEELKKSKEATKNVYKGALKYTKESWLQYGIYGSLETKLETIAYGYRELLLEEMIHLFVDSSGEKYRQAFPSLPVDNIQNLHENIGKYIVSKAYHQDLDRLLKALESGDLVDIKTEYEDRKVNSESRSVLSDRSQRVIIAYELYIDSRLSQEQVQDISDFTTYLKSDSGQKRFPYRIVERIMAAGKTFILGTLLSTIKADGVNLSLLVVPRALYTSEASNLIDRTLDSFGGSGFSFKLARDDIDNLDKLHWLYSALQNAIKLQQYVIIPPETLLTIHNMFAESCLGEEVSKSFNILQSIFKLLREHGAATFDEIDMTFDPVQELNFPIQDEDMLSESDLPQQITMMEETIFELFSSSQPHDYTRNLSIRKEDYEEIRSVLISSMAEKISGKTFFMPIVPQNDENLFNFSRLSEPSEALKDFFTIDETDPKASVAYAKVKDAVSDRTYELLALVRMIIRQWLFTSWSGNINENYGFGGSKLYAIPYASNNNPKLGSEYSSRWLGYIRTIRTYLVLGFSEASAKRAVGWLAREALERIKASGVVGQSEEEILLQNLLGLNALSVDLDDQKSVDQILTKLQNYHKESSHNLLYLKFMFSWIANDLIHDIKYFKRQISSNAQDLKLMLNSIQGYTGTLSTVKILPEDFHNRKDEERLLLDKDIDARISERIRDNSPYDIVECEDGLSSVEFLKNASSVIAKLEREKRPFGAILDVGAYFKDETNEAIAESLLCLTKVEVDANGVDVTSPLKEGVLFFSTKENKLAVKVQGQKDAKIISSISRRNLIEQTPAAYSRLTFYDQQHTTGVDIFQDDSSFALIIVGLTTTLRDFNQAVMRMRKLLSADQKIVVVVPQSVMKSIRSELCKGDLDTVDRMDVIEFTRRNLDKKSRMQNVMAMMNMVRAICKDQSVKLLLSEDRFVKNQFCPDIWLKNTEILLEDMVQVKTEEKIGKIINQAVGQYVSAVAVTFGTEEEQAKFKEDLEKIVKLSLAETEDYPETLKIKATEDNEQTVESQTETTVLAEVENEVELTVDQVTRSRCTVTLPPFDIEGDFPEELKERTGLGDGVFFTFDNYIEQYPALDYLKGMFKPNLYLSSTFNNILFGQYRRYIFNVLLLRSEVEDDKVIIFTPIEAQKSIEIMKRSNGRLFGFEAHILDPMGYVIYSEHPERVDLRSYQDLFCNILTFGGYYRELSKPEWREVFKNWLWSHSDEHARRSILFKEIILSQPERKRLDVTPLGKLMGVDHDVELGIQKDFDFSVLRIITQDKPNVSLAFEELQKTSIIDPTPFIDFLDMNLFAAMINRKKLRELAAPSISNYIISLMTGNSIDSKAEKVIDRVAKMLMRDKFQIAQLEAGAIRILDPVFKAVDNGVDATALRLLMARLVHYQKFSGLKWLNHHENVEKFDDIVWECDSKRLWEAYPDIILNFVSLVKYSDFFHRDLARDVVSLPTATSRVFDLQVVLSLIRDGCNQHTLKEFTAFWRRIHDDLDAEELRRICEALFLEAVPASFPRDYLARTGKSTSFTKFSDLKVLDERLCDLKGFDYRDFFVTILDKCTVWYQLAWLFKLSETDSSIREFVPPGLLEEVTKRFPRPWRVAEIKQAAMDHMSHVIRPK